MIAVIGTDGWMSAESPPDDARIVQVAWDDNSFGPASIAFYESVDGKEDLGKVWWSVSPLQQLPEGHVFAWRERVR